MSGWFIFGWVSFKQMIKFVRSYLNSQVVSSKLIAAMGILMLDFQILFQKYFSY